MDDIATVVLGLLGGIVGGLLGVGGGILFVPALAIFQDQPQVEAEATSLLAILPVAIVATWRQRGYGNVRLRDGLVIGALSPLGVAAGVVAANELSQRVLELSFAALLIVIAVRLLIRGLRGPPQAPTDAFESKLGMYRSRGEGRKPQSGEPTPATPEMATQPTIDPVARRLMAAVESELNGRRRQQAPSTSQARLIATRVGHGMLAASNQETARHCDQVVVQALEAATDPARVLP